MKNILLHSLWTFICWGLYGNSQQTQTTTIEAINDYFTIPSLDPTDIDILANDKGDNLKLKKVIQYPCCGHLQEIEEDGTITYTPKTAGNYCVEDSFIYLIEDEAGNIAMAEVFLQIPPPDLIVEVDRDCSNTESTGVYLLNIFVKEGIPPFTISGSINETVNDFGIISVVIENGNMYEIIVIDATGNEFFEIGGEISCFPLCPIVAIEEPSIIGHCTCDGQLVPDLQDFLGYEETLKSIDGQWFDGINEIDFSLGDTIPQNTLVHIYDIWTSENCYYFREECQDFGVRALVSNICAPESYQIKTNEDEVFIEPNDTIAIPVLQNDKGTQLQIRQILTSPNCGEILEVNQETGMIRYASNASLGCLEDSFVYQVEDACDNLEEAMVYIDIEKEEEEEEENKELIVEVTKDCINVTEIGNYQLVIEIVSGVSPFVLSGSIDTTLEEIGMVSKILSIYEFYEVNVFDAIGSAFYQQGGENPCPNTCSDLPVQTIEEIAHCLYNGNMVINFGELIEAGSNATLNGYSLGNGIEYVEFQQGDTIPSNTFIILDAIYTEDSCYTLFPSEISGMVSDFCPTPIIQARPDFIAAKINEATTFNLLANDIGEGIFIEQITRMPPCGTLELVDATLGTVRYTPNEEYFEEIVFFSYQIQDNEGNTSDTTSMMVKDRGTSEMVVGLVRDCSMAEITGTYTVNVAIAKGTPPFVVTGLIDTTLNDAGVVSKELEDGLTYEIHVIDAEGNEAYGAGGEIGCPKLHGPIYIEGLDDLGDCTCDGGFEFFEDEDAGNINGFWYENGNKHFIEQGTIVPRDTYLEIFEIGLACQYYPIIYHWQTGFTGWVYDFCFNYEFKAEPDFVSIERGDTTEICVLENDKGTNLSLKQVDYSLQCGEILNIDYENGIITYRSHPSTHCEQDQIEYYIIDSCGNTKKGIVTIDLNHEQNLIVEIERDCTDENETGIYQLIVNIVEGQAPFTISGSINETLEEMGSISIEIEDGIPYEIQVIDADGNDFFETGGEVGCGAYCQEYQSLHIPNLEAIAECTCDGGLRFHFEGIALEEDFEVWGNYSTGSTYSSLEIEANQVVPNDYHLEFSRLNIFDVCYHLWIGNELGFNGKVADFCMNKVPPTPTIDKYASETLLCGEGEIVLIAEGGGEEAIYHWYKEYNPNFPSSAVLADPPTGVIWVNSEMVGAEYIYLVSTDTSGCTSEPLEIFYQHYSALEIENQNIVVDDSCKNYQVSFDIIGGSGFYEIGGEPIPDEFTSEWIPIEENYNFTINDYDLYWLCDSVSVNGTVMPIDSTNCDFTPISNIQHPTPNIQVYPNPSNGNFTLFLQLEQAETINIQVLDILGQEKLWQRLQTLPTVERQNFDLNLNLPSGLYFLQVSGKNWRWIEKVIVR